MVSICDMSANDVLYGRTWKCNESKFSKAEKIITEALQCKLLT